MSDPITKLSLKEKNIIPFFLGLNAIAGLILFIIFILPRSEVNNQLIFGLSTLRVLIAIVFLVLLLINVGAILIALFEFGPWQVKLKNIVVGLSSNYYADIMVSLYTVLILTGAFLLLSVPPITT